MIFVAVLAFSATSAGAQDDNSAYVGAEVKSATELNTSQPQVAAATTTRSNAVSNATLAFTGGDVFAVALVGGVAVLAGASLLLVRRQQSAA